MTTGPAHPPDDDPGHGGGKSPPADAPTSGPLPAPARDLDLPVHEEPWDDRVSLRREDLYGDDGR